MPGFYIKRGDKVAGPVDAAKLKQLVASGKVLATDALAKAPSGPWTEAGKTPLFANGAISKESTRPIESKPAALVPTVERVPTAIPEQNGRPRHSNALVKSVAVVGRGTLAAGSGVFRFLSVRSQRRHELKMAKVNARAVVAAQKTSSKQNEPTSSVVAPAINVTNVNTNTIVHAAPRSSKSRLTAAILALLVGHFGFHKFYLGQGLSGIIRLILACTVVGLIVTVPLALLEGLGLLLSSDASFERRYP